MFKNQVAIDTSKSLNELRGNLQAEAGRLGGEHAACEDRLIELQCRLINDEQNTTTTQASIDIERHTLDDINEQLNEVLELEDQLNLSPDQVLIAVFGDKSAVDLYGDDKTYKPVSEMADDLIENPERKPEATFEPPVLPINDGWKGI